MNAKNKARAVIAASMLLLTGCASTRASTAPQSHTAPPASTAMTAGMVMPDGSTMPAPAPRPTAAGNPTVAEKMICAAETHADIRTVLGLAVSPVSTASWRDHLYTCTYRLPMGTLIISVKQSADPAAATAYFDAQRTTLAGAQTLDGLGQSAYGAKAGTVVLIKDSAVLTVDASRLPAAFGAQRSKRFDFAYEIASDILGCWTGG